MTIYFSRKKTYTQTYTYTEILLLFKMYTIIHLFCAGSRTTRTRRSPLPSGDSQSSRREKCERHVRTVCKVFKQKRGSTAQGASRSARGKREACKGATELTTERHVGTEQARKGMC